MLCIAMFALTVGSTGSASQPADLTCCKWDRVGLFVLPGETLRLRLDSTQGCGIVTASGELLDSRSGFAEWVAPIESGLYGLLILEAERTRVVNVFVMIPFDSLVDGRLRGVWIGRYPRDASFAKLGRPRGFVEVTRENETAFVSPRYTLGEFAVNQFTAYPKYIAIREEAVRKLELLTDLVAAKGHGNQKLRIISGFRTPARQRRSGGHRQSAHMYGAAVDVYVDVDTNGMMDDLNRDGRIDRRDAQLLSSYVDELEVLAPDLVGGCGWYRRRGSRGPFIHLDVRGERQRWHQ